METKSNKSGNFFLGFFLGGLIGGILIFLLGTEEGKKTAKELTKKLEGIEDDIRNKGGKILEKAETAKENISKEASYSQKNIAKTVSAKLDEGFTRIEDAQKKGVTLTQKVHKRLFKKNGKKLKS